MAMAAVDIGKAWTADAAPRASRWSGAAVGFSVAFVAALIGFGFDARFLVLGVPAATIAGWILGPKVGPADGLLGMSVAMGVVTIAVADALAVTASAALSVAYGGIGLLPMIAGWVFVWAAGFVIYGLPIMAVTVPCGMIWVVLVRALGRESGPAAS
jgi:hypothetical protein